MGAQEWHTACHEASHATCAWLLGAMVQAGPISITPGRSYTGICFAGRAPKYRDADLAGISAPYPLLPARVRRQYESRVMMLPGGWIGESLHSNRREPEPSSETDEGTSAGPKPEILVPLPVREQAVLDVAAARDISQSDLSRALEALEALHFGDVDIAERHCRFLSAETEALLSGRTPARMVTTLATELMCCRTTPARLWKSVLANAASA
jgi:hypothetical protein